MLPRVVETPRMKSRLKFGYFKAPLSENAWSRNSPWKRTRLHRSLDAWREALKLTPAQPPTPESIVANAARGVLVRAQLNTRLIVISCDSTNPQKIGRSARR